METLSGRGGQLHLPLMGAHLESKLVIVYIKGGEQARVLVVYIEVYKILINVLVEYWCKCLIILPLRGS